MRKTLWVFSISMLFVLPLFAQTAPQEVKPEVKPETRSAPYMGDPATRPAPLGQQVVKTFYLSGPEPTRVQDVVNALRVILEFQRVQPVPMAHAIVVRGNAEQVAAAEKLVRDIDRPGLVIAAGSYKLDFTLSDIENGKKVGTRTYSVVVKRGRDQHDAENAKYRVGSRVAVNLGSMQPANGGASQMVNTAYQYMDVGVSIDCRLWGEGDDLTLESTVETSSFANPQETSGHPTTRQAKSNSVVTITPGKPLLVSSLDSADSPRRTEIEVVATKLK